nr:cyclin-dependent kinase inhibitor 1C-like [Aegilops tauschii subsp. strangulata]
MALNELAAVVDAPAPVPTPIPVPTPLTILVALTGWSLSTIAEPEAAGVSEVSADPRELLYMPAHVPVPVRAHAPTVVPVPVPLPAPNEPMPVCAPYSAAWDAAVDRYLTAPRVTILPHHAYFNNVVPEDDNDNAGAARRLRRHGN